MLSKLLLGAALFFTAPKDWKTLDSKEIQKKYKHFEAGCVGPSKKGLLPSLNLTKEKIGSLSLNNYLDAVKNLYEADPNNLEWKKLGIFHTTAGRAYLTQIEKKTAQGVVLLLQLIFIEKETAYILTAASLKEEFALFYKDFETAFRSFTLH